MIKSHVFRLDQNKTLYKIFIEESDIFFCKMLLISQLNICASIFCSGAEYALNLVLFRKIWFEFYDQNLKKKYALTASLI